MVTRRADGSPSSAAAAVATFAAIAVTAGHGAPPFAFVGQLLSSLAAILINVNEEAERYLLRSRCAAPADPGADSPRRPLQGTRRPDPRCHREPSRPRRGGLRLRVRERARAVAADDLAPPADPPRSGPCRGVPARNLGLLPPRAGRSSRAGARSRRPGSARTRRLAGPYQGIGLRSRKKPPLGAPSGSVASQTGVLAPSSTERRAFCPPMSVRTQPGQTELTRMFSSSSSAVNIRVSALRPVFDTR